MNDSHYCPHTPEEIAVSVVAELIAVRREGSRRRGGTETARDAAQRVGNADQEAGR